MIFSWILLHRFLHVPVAAEQDDAVPGRVRIFLSWGMAGAGRLLPCSADMFPDDAEIVERGIIPGSVLRNGHKLRVIRSALCSQPVKDRFNHCPVL